MIAEWVEANWSLDLTLREWWRRLARAGHAFPTWPEGLGGRGASGAEAREVAAALSAAGAIGPPTGLGTLMGGPVVQQSGTPEQHDRFLPGLADGTEGWCQLFSEPGAGSDLAGLAARAERDGDEWVVTGQKVWTSGAEHAARGMLIARTDPDLPKHRGITYFVIEMDQPGIEVRPLVQMNRRRHFSEVFLTEARVPDRDRIGDVNGGWAVAVATLGFERSGLGAAGGVAGVRPAAGERAGNLDRCVGEIIERAQARRQVPDADAGSFRTLRRVAGELERLGEPAIRQGLARLHSLERIAAVSQQRAAAAARAGRPPGAESSITKLFWTEGLKLSRDLAMQILGPWGALEGPTTPGRGLLQQFVLTMPSASIAGGSDEIQRNIIGERALGLPKEPQVDRDVAFREIPRS